jgi:hypothetical protein
MRNEKKYIKSGNSIMHVDKKGKETSLSYNPLSEEYENLEWN